MVDGLTQFLLASNDVTLAAILVVGFSLLAYIASHNWRNSVAQSLCFLLGSLLLVLSTALLMRQARTPPTINVLWRIQWIGFVYTPAAYLHFGLTLLRSTGLERRWHHWVPWLVYGVSTLFWGLASWEIGLTATAITTQADIVARPFAPFRAGPFFWAFIAYFLALTIAGMIAIRHARRRAMTPATRRRLFYLSTSFLAPLLGVFPYLLIAATANHLSMAVLLMILGTSTSAGGVMMTLMTYSVAFHGVLVPDRIVKYNFLRYILYGPLVGVTLILCMKIVDPLVNLTGLPSQTISIFGVIVMTVLMPILIARIRPTVDMLIYRQDRDEMRWLRGIENHAFTRSDLRQLLENTLVAVCGAIGTETGFVAVPAEQGFLVQVSCGPRRAIKQFLHTWTLDELLSEAAPRGETRTETPTAESFLVHDGFCLLPLYATNGRLVGAIGVACEQNDLTLEARQLIGTLAHQMELALSHMQLQEGVFNSLRGLSPQSESLHQLNTDLELATPETLNAHLAPDVALLPDFPQIVKDALSHYWGGPKLSDSPLLGMRAVRNVLDVQGGSPTKALQAVLRQAIENIRPEEQLEPTAPEWMLYNILELRFLRGLRIREIVNKLAMSESDYYRKQRVAVEEVARQLALMEDEHEQTILPR